MTWRAALVLENGRVFQGRGFGAEVEATGEVVFNTSITGYQEILTDPSYCGQIVVMTATQIGNVGTNNEDAESARLQQRTRRLACAGFAIRELSPVPSNWRSHRTVEAMLVENGIPGIEDIDTRALTRMLRDEGAMRGAITPHVTEIDAVRARVTASPSMAGQDLVPRVTCEARYEWAGDGGWYAPDDSRHPALPPVSHHVVAYDFGIKENILRQLRGIGCRVTVVPANTPGRDALALGADGFFLSNGPGDPSAVAYGVEATKELCASGKPVFGICLGHQILGLALGATTRKLPFGHHGGNHPVLDKATGKVEITSQNHGFVVDPETLPSGVHVTHDNLFDHSNEGIAVSDKPIFSVQYHPEASPGPHDAHYLFERFRDHLVKVRR